MWNGSCSSIPLITGLILTERQRAAERASACSVHGCGLGVCIYRQVTENPCVLSLHVQGRTRGENPSYRLIANAAFNE